MFRTLMRKPITSIEQLRKITNDNRTHTFAILLGDDGFVYSKKIIYRKKDIYYIENCIDESTQELHEDDLMDNNLTHIGEAIIKNSFIML